MSKLVDELRRAQAGRGPQQSVVDEGTRCPVCRERVVEVYLSVSVRRRQFGSNSATGRYNAEAPGDEGRGQGMFAARAGLWQGMCYECAASIQDEIAERAQRFDYLKRVRDAEGER